MNWEIIEKLCSYKHLSGQNLLLQITDEDLSTIIWMPRAEQEQKTMNKEIMEEALLR